MNENKNKNVNDENEDKSKTKYFFFFSQPPSPKRIPFVAFANQKSIHFNSLPVLTFLVNVLETRSQKQTTQYPIANRDAIVIQQYTQSHFSI